MAEEAPEIETVRTTRVSCDGGALGHPKVWYEIPQDVGWVECGYCDKGSFSKRKNRPEANNRMTAAAGAAA